MAPSEQSRSGRKTRGDCVSEREDARTCPGTPGVLGGSSSEEGALWGAHARAMRTPLRRSSRHFCQSGPCPRYPRARGLVGHRIPEGGRLGGHVRSLPNLGGIFCKVNPWRAASSVYLTKTRTRRNSRKYSGERWCAPGPVPSPPPRRPRAFLEAVQGAPWVTVLLPVPPRSRPTHAHPAATRTRQPGAAGASVPPRGTRGQGAASSTGLDGCPPRDSHRRPSSEAPRRGAAARRALRAAS